LSCFAKTTSSATPEAKQKYEVYPKGTVQPARQVLYENKKRKLFKKSNAKLFDVFQIALC
jgi:hypothetical protein